MLDPIWNRSPKKRCCNLCISLFCLPLLCQAATKDQDTLQTVFSEALSHHSTSFGALTSQLGVADDTSHGYKETCFQHGQNFTALVECLRHEVKCLNIGQLEELFSISKSKNLTSEQVAALSPALVFSLLACEESSDASHHELSDSGFSHDHHDHDHHDKEAEKPSIKESWGYSFLFVTLINLSSLTGALVLPCMRMKSFKIILMFMVGIAVGTLVGSGLLFLIPEAFGLTHDDEDQGYVWKASAIVGGVYLFYLVEKVLRFINYKRENTPFKRAQDEEATKGISVPSFQRNPVDNSLPGRTPPGDIAYVCDCVGTESVSVDMSSTSSTEDNLLGSTNDDKCPSSEDNNNVNFKMDHKSGEVAPVAYMVIFGDALHNFIDGLSIGSAFTVSLMTGVSVSVACLCEELPHELGDLAILLNSGMRFKRALCYNFVSSCTCYLGTAVGIILGVNTSSSTWIFAVAGGMFLYIALVDMMPEMNSASESEEARQLGPTKVFLVQNAGLLLGYFLMFGLALLGGCHGFLEDV